MSDFHFGSKESDWEDTTMIDKFHSFIRKKENEIDLLVISGDVGAKGKVSDYEKAFKGIEKISNNLGIDREKVMIVPGNHDADRDESPIRSYANFIHFLRDFYPEEMKEKFDFDKSPEELFNVFDFTEDFNLLFLCANSGIRIKQIDGKGKVEYGLIGDKQIRNIRNYLSNHSYPEDVIKIFVIHHSLCPVEESDISALRDQNELNELLKDEGFSILLHGHQHFDRIYTIGRGKHELLLVGTGHIYEEFKRTNCFSSFNILTFHNLDKKPKAVKISIQPFVYSKGNWGEHGVPLKYRFSPDLEKIFGPYPNLEKYIYEEREKLKNSSEGSIIEDSLSYVDELLEKVHQNMFIAGQQQALEHYTEKLKHLERDFFTTTFLGSSFWWIPDDQFHIVTDNIETAKRLKEKKVKEPIRRLILLEEPLDQFIERTVNKIVEDIKREIDALESEWSTTIKHLKVMKEHITMKLFIPKGAFWNKFLNAEIACYDDKEFDFFTRDRRNNITGVEIYFDYKKYPHSKKRGEMESFITMFNQAWNSTKTIPLDKFIDQFEEELWKAKHAISYEKNWLLSYLKDYNEEDKKLKDAESNVLFEMIGDKKFRRYLDIGEGMGRYSIMFANKDIAEDIVGIDFDRECTKVAEHETKAKSLSNIRHECEDIINYNGNGKFDIITCMMGTISHIAEQGNLEKFMNKLEDLTDKGGLIYISAWNRAERERTFLSIYTEYEKKRLAENSPSCEELEKLFEEYNFKINNERKVDRLTLYEIESKD